jgi:hypothetical protein
MLNIFYPGLPSPPVVTFGSIIFGFVTVVFVVSKPSEYGS